MNNFPIERLLLQPEIRPTGLEKLRSRVGIAFGAHGVERLPARLEQNGTYRACPLFWEMRNRVSAK